MLKVMPLCLELRHGQNSIDSRLAPGVRLHMQCRAMNYIEGANKDMTFCLMASSGGVLCALPLPLPLPFLLPLAEVFADWAGAEAQGNNGVATASVVLARGTKEHAASAGRASELALHVSALGWLCRCFAPALRRSCHKPSSS